MCTAWGRSSWNCWSHKPTSRLPCRSWSCTTASWTPPRSAALLAEMEGACGERGTTGGAGRRDGGLRAPRHQAFPQSHSCPTSPCSRLSSRPQAINLLPANTQINDIRIFLEKVLEENAQKKRFNQVLKNLLHAEFLRV